MRNAGTDGWDCLIARGVSVYISAKSITWYKCGFKYSIFDTPSEIITNPDCTNCHWHRMGKKHRDGDKPAVVALYPNGVVKSHVYMLNDKVHREDRPAMIEWSQNGKITLTSYYENGKHVRNNGPSIINKRMAMLSWNIDGLSHRDDGPAFVLGRGRLGVIRIEYYTHGKCHREHGPAVIMSYRGGAILEWYHERGCIKKMHLDKKDPQVRDELTVLWKELPKYMSKTDDLFPSDY